MDVVASATVLAVQDLDRAADWFARVLGCARSDPDPGAWAFLTSGPLTFMLGSCPDAPPARGLGDHSYVAYVTVDDVDAYAARAEREHAEVLQPVGDRPWGMRELLLRTPDGHRIMVGQRIAD